MYQFLCQFLDGDSLPKANVHLNRTFTSEKSLPTLIPHCLAFKTQAQQPLNGCWPGTPSCPGWSWGCQLALGRQVTCQAASPSVTSLCIWIGKGGWRRTVCFVLKPRFVCTLCLYTVLLAPEDSGTLARKCRQGGRALWFIAWSALREGLESKRLHSSVGLGLRS